jgi:hypothetical protein
MTWLTENGISPISVDVGQLDAESVGDAVGVVEVGRDLAGIVDLAVGQAVVAEPDDVRFVDASGIECQFLGEAAERAGPRRNRVWRRSAGDPVRQLWVGLLGTEQLSVLLQSVRRVIDRAHSDSDRPPLGDRQW